MYITLQFAKKHLNLENDFTDDDDYIEQLIVVSEQIVEIHINQSFSDLTISITNTDGTTETILPTPLAHAVLLLVGNFYENRSPVAFASVNKIPYNFEYLLDFYKNYSN